MTRKLTCLSLKVSYRNRDAARMAMHRRFESVHSRRGRPVLLRVYRCDQCGDYHLTSAIPEVRDGKWRGLGQITAR